MRGKLNKEEVQNQRRGQSVLKGKEEQWKDRTRRRTTAYGSWWSSRKWRDLSLLSSYTHTYTAMSFGNTTHVQSYFILLLIGDVHVFSCVIRFVCRFLRFHSGIINENDGERRRTRTKHRQNPNSPIFWYASVFMPYFLLSVFQDVRENGNLYLFHAEMKKISQRRITKDSKRHAKSRLERLDDVYEKGMSFGIYFPSLLLLVTSLHSCVRIRRHFCYSVACLVVCLCKIFTAGFIDFPVVLFLFLCVCWSLYVFHAFSWTVQYLLLLPQQQIIISRL